MKLAAYAAALPAAAMLLAACTPAFRECPPIAPEQLAALPARLSETGLAAPGVRAFAPRFALWSDGADKQRWIYVPPGARIDTRDPDAWRFPQGTKLWKEFSRDGVRVETRLLYKHGPGATEWTPVAYVWSGDDAWATPDGARDAAGTKHDVPSAAQCMGCHGGTASGVLGFSAVQLATPSALADLFTAPVAAVDIPGDATAQAALGYLHANCSHCHNQRRPERDGPRCFDPQRAFDFTLRTNELATVESTATYRTAREIANGIPTRVRSRDPWWGMPALGTESVDEDGAKLLETWIDSL